MLFNSVGYLVFLPVVVGVTFLLPNRFRWMWLLAASYFFYMCWNAAYALLLVASTLIAYFAGLVCDSTQDHRKKKLALAASVVVNLSILVVFKYWRFINHSMTGLFGALHWRWPVPDLDVLLPVGISFFTFQSMSYTFDVYRGKIKAERHLGYLGLYKAFFPQMVAGPIERGGHLLPQFRADHPWDWARVASGLELILWGLFKKVVIADRLSLFVDAVYNNVPRHNATDYALATYLFAFQIYCDFSGYSDIAIGSARILGIDLMKNFYAPYFSRSIQEFWRRWHISLSTWLRDYLYIPLGGSRNGKFNTYKNLLVTMLLGGLWHGASWNFVAWGGIHGILLCGSRGSRLSTAEIDCQAWWVKGLKIFITFNLVCFAWIFFRSSSWADTLTILNSFGHLQFGRPFIDPVSLFCGMAGIAVLLLVEVCYVRRPKFSLGLAPRSCYPQMGMLLRDHLCDHFDRC